MISCEVISNKFLRRKTCLGNCSSHVHIRFVVDMFSSGGFATCTKCFPLEGRGLVGFTKCMQLAPDLQQLRHPVECGKNSFICLSSLQENKTICGN